MILGTIYTDTALRAHESTYDVANAPDGQNQIHNFHIWRVSLLQKKNITKYSKKYHMILD